MERNTLILYMLSWSPLALVLTQVRLPSRLAHQIRTMVYLNNAISLSLLLGTGNVVVFAAAALLGHDMNSAHVVCDIRLQLFD